MRLRYPSHSTELWEWQPDVMNYALALHDRLMRLTLAACSGYEITTEGDAFLVIDEQGWVG